MVPNCSIRQDAVDIKFAESVLKHIRFPIIENAVPSREAHVLIDGMESNSFCKKASQKIAPATKDHSVLVNRGLLGCLLLLVL